MRRRGPGTRHEQLAYLTRRNRERYDIAWQLRAWGRSYAEIGEYLGVTPGRARDMVTVATRGRRLAELLFYGSENSLFSDPSPGAPAAGPSAGMTDRSRSNLEGPCGPAQGPLRPDLRPSE
jgi:hypothetical protein